MQALSGFAHAPVTKAVLIASAGASVFAQASSIASRRSTASHVASLASHSLVLQSPGELLFAGFLLYYFRMVERQTGSAKFSMFAFLVTGISVAAQYTFCRFTHTATAALVSGPYALIFAQFIPFFLDVPPSSKFSVLGLRLSDKTFVYLAGLQLLLARGWPSLLAGAAGLCAGALWRVNVLGVQALRFPRALVSGVSRLLGPLLQEGGGSAQGAPAAGRGQSRPQPGRAGSAGASGMRQQQPGRPGGMAAGAAPHAPLPAASPEALESLCAMGFERGAAQRALQATDNDVAAAISLLV